MEDEKKYFENQAKLYKKKSKLRELVLQCDWKKDGYMLLGGKRVEYISAAKVARNFAPLLPKVGLEIITQFGEPTHYEPVGQKGEEHFVIPFMVCYVDTDTGASTVPSTYYGEAVDPRDKGLKKACTDARKLWLITEFNIEEGIDPDAGVNDTTGAYVPKDEQEQVEIKTKIAAVAVKPKAPAPKPKKAEETPETETTEESTENKPVEEVKEEPAPAAPKKPGRPAKPKTEPKAEEPTPAPAPVETDDSKVAPGMNTEYGAKITEPQKKPLYAAFGKWRDAHMAGKISDAKFEEVKEAYRNIGSNREIIRFLTEYREVKE